jgi:hypothetical protein
MFMYKVRKAILIDKHEVDFQHINFLFAFNLVVKM